MSICATPLNMANAAMVAGSKHDNSRHTAGRVLDGNKTAGVHADSAALPGATVVRPSETDIRVRSVPLWTSASQGLVEHAHERSAIVSVRLTLIELHELLKRGLDRDLSLLSVGNYQVAELGSRVE
jgi:hypothetical protein